MEAPRNTILQGDALALLRGLPDGCVQTCITSPPYWGLRDYGIAGQLGLETGLAQYVLRMVEIFGEVRRVLRSDGTLWLNLGDSYMSSGAKWTGRNDTDRNTPGGRGGSFQGGARQKINRTRGEVKPKELCMIPARVALALQGAGWWLRSDIIWSKSNAMPESVTDRPTRSHEYLFLFTKSQRYYYNAAAVREPGRNRRSVWTVATSSYQDAHFATFPPALIEPCILAGSRPGDLVLDPFMGSGTTAAVAAKHLRDWLGLELNPAYIDIARRRLDGGVQTSFLSLVM